MSLQGSADQENSSAEADGPIYVGRRGGQYRLVVSQLNGKQYRKYLKRRRKKNLIRQEREPRNLTQSSAESNATLDENHPDHRQLADGDGDEVVVHCDEVDPLQGSKVPDPDERISTQPVGKKRRCCSWTSCRLF